MVESRAKSKAYSWAKDAAERVFWTFIQVGLGGISVELFDLPPWAVVPVATGIAALKTYVAKHVSNKGTASTAPGV